MLKNGGRDVLKRVNRLEIGGFLRNKSALYREVFLFELKKVIAFAFI